LRNKLEKLVKMLICIIIENIYSIIIASINRRLYCILKIFKN